MFSSSIVPQFFVLCFVLSSIETQSIDLSQEPLIFPETFVPSQLLLTDIKFNGIGDDVTELSHAATAFSVDFVKRASKLLLGNGTNAIIAPHSIWTLLLPLADGSSDRTYEQLTSVLHLPANLRKVHRAYKVFEYACNENITSHLRLDQSQVLFFDENRPFDTDYQDKLDYVYRADYYPVNFFKSDEAVDEINNYIKERTNEKIYKVVEHHDIMPISAVNFIGQWNTPHESKQIQPFYDEFGELMDDIPYVVRKGDVIELGTKKVEVPYGNDNEFIMLLLMPEQNVPLPTYIASVELQHITNLFQFISLHQRSTNDYVFMPRFSVTSSVNLNGVLKDMGLTELFSGKANFAKITPHEVNNISLFHKAVINVQENDMVNDTTVDTPTFLTPNFHTVNRPFVFLIIERTTQTFLMAGSVGDPRK